MKREPIKFFLMSIILACLCTTNLAFANSEIQQLEKRIEYLKKKEILEGKIKQLENELLSLTREYETTQNTNTTTKPKPVATKPSSSEHSETNISVENYLDLVIGNTLLGQSNNGTRWKVFFKSNGRIVFNSEQGFYDEGSWKIEKSQLCLKWTKIRKGKVSCSDKFKKKGQILSGYSHLTKERSYRKYVTGTKVEYENVNALLN